MNQTTLTLFPCIVLLFAIAAIGDNYNYHDWPVPPKSPNFRKEYDQLLFGFVEDHIYRSEAQLIMLYDHFDQYLTNKTDQMFEFLQDEVNNQIIILGQTKQNNNDYYHARNDWNQLETYLVQKMENEMNLLLTFFQKLLDDMKNSLVSTTTTAGMN
ncbi:uncharacterized protein LOC113793187 [Dermatophagoides pteronyssinus]|uniref:uncharacterized protein LOC113793187 n=1 Tax=Dermatophagoides pteronyssinus TaxID=6956 RepID=UPI003F681E49